MIIHNKQFPSNPTTHTKEFFRVQSRIVSVVKLALNHYTTEPLSFALNIVVAVSYGFGVKKAHFDSSRERSETQESSSNDGPAGESAPSSPSMQRNSSQSSLVACTEELFNQYFAPPSPQKRDSESPSQQQ
ncbi:hypothetical protein ACTXT7_005704 [Hymenolepis weldensis]